MVALSLHTSFDIPLRDPRIIALFLVAVITVTAFFVVEKHFAREPVLPLEVFSMRTRGW